MAEHAGQWLFEEGYAFKHGSNFKKKNLQRARSMIEASASSGFPLAVAYCCYQGWNGMEKDKKKSFDMHVKIEQETNGYHWAQFLLGVCYDYGRGTDQDHTKVFELYTKSSEQGNSDAMNSLGVKFLKRDQGQDHANAVELFLKSAQLGHSTAMFNCGACYAKGVGTLKDVIKARKYYLQATAQKHIHAPTFLDQLNASIKDS